MKKYILILFLLSIVTTMLGQETDLDARAKFLSDLTRPRLVDWPNSKSNFVIGIIKHQELAEELKKFEGERKGLFVKNLKITSHSLK